MLYTGENEYSAREQFEMKTDLAHGGLGITTVMPIIAGGVREMGRVGPWGGDPALPEGRFEQMRMTDLEYMRIISCNPDAIKVIKKIILLFISCSDGMCLG